jgi:hypothetical protein
MFQSILTYIIITLAVALILRKIYTAVVKKPVVCKPGEPAGKNDCSACTENCVFKDPNI